MVHATYDEVADALYIRLRDAAVARTIEADPYRIVDLDEHDEPVGLEVLYPSRNLAIAGVARAFGFADHLDAIDNAVMKALGTSAPATVTVTYSWVAPTGVPVATGARSWDTSADVIETVS